MSPGEVGQIRHGIYRIYWKGDTRSSLAAVGSNAAGDRWYAPTNWIAGVPCYDWSIVDRVEKLMPHSEMA